MTKPQTHVHPDLLKAVEMAVSKAVDRRLEGMNVIDLKECREKLESTRHALLDMQQNFEVWRKLAELRGDQSEARGAQVNQLQEELTQLRVQIALLTSALENAGISHGDTAT